MTDNICGKCKQPLRPGEPTITMRWNDGDTETEHRDCTAAAVARVVELEAMQKDMWHVIIAGSIRHTKPPTEADWEWVRMVLADMEANPDDYEPIEIA